MLPRRKRIERAAGRIGLRMLIGPLRMMPLQMARACGRWLGKALYGVLGRYRRVALKNLQLVYAEEYDESMRRRMACAVFEHFGEAAAEFVKLPQLDRSAVDALVIVEGEENLC